MVLRMLSCPKTGAQLFGARANPGCDISLIVPDNDVLGSVLSRKVRRMARLPDEDISLTANFCQAPRPDRFSIVAYRRKSIMQVAAFITISWHLDCFEEPGESAQSKACSLIIHFESIFVDARMRGQGYACALQDATSFWCHKLLIDLDKKWSSAPGRNQPDAVPDCTLDVVFTGNARSSFDPDILRRFERSMRSGVESVSEDHDLRVFRQIRMHTEVTLGGKPITF